MRFRYSDRFQRAYANLRQEDAERVDKTLRLLMSDLRHPGLRVKNMDGTDRIWEARVSRSIRLTFEMHGELLMLRNVGPHDAALKNP